MDEICFTSPPAIACARSPSDDPESIESAIFGPTPLTETSIVNISRSSAVAKPKSASASSLTTCAASSFASSPWRGSRS